MERTTRMAAAVAATCAVSVAGGIAVSGATSADRTAGASAAKSRTVTVTLRGGHATHPVDNGRPVALVAALLGVPEAVFREAFSHVTPAAAGVEPDPAQVARNKAALLRVLAPYGVTNESLDRASDTYRYSGAQGQTWTQTAAVVKATVTGGRITSVQLVRGGAGYTSAPVATVPGVPGGTLEAKVSFSRDVATNGRISAIRITVKG